MLGAVIAMLLGNEKTMVRQILKKWDNGDDKVRERMLLDFVEQCEHLTAPELEQQFNDCASLFNARIIAWLRISYMNNPCLDLLLKGLAVMVGSVSGQYFLIEFLEVGGILTLMECLNSPKESVKKEALFLLTIIANKGRQYKELLCESFGVKLVAECLAVSPSSETQETARNLLYQLSSGNPCYQSQVYKALISLLSCASSDAQRMAAYTLRQIQDAVGVASASIVEPTLQLLKSLHLGIQHEALELLCMLVNYEEVQQSILTGLVGILKLQDDTTNSMTKLPSSDASTSRAPLSIYIQQAAAAKAIRLLVSQSPDLGEHFLRIQVVPYLLLVMGNVNHCNAQKQASLTLFDLVNQFPPVKVQVGSLMGEDFFCLFMEDPENLHNVMTPSQVDVLVGAVGQDHTNQ